jgi:hypothetical protein
MAFSSCVHAADNVGIGPCRCQATLAGGKSLARDSLNSASSRFNRLASRAFATAKPIT